MDQAFSVIGGLVLSEGVGTVAGPYLICDLMLVRLCRWLRMGGFDVVLPDGIGDDDLVTIGRDSGRYILTRDKDLSKRARLKVILLKRIDLDGQLDEVIKTFPEMKDVHRPSNCPMCNGHLTMVSKSSIKVRELDAIPRKVKEDHGSFLVCEDCGKSYWKGTHWERIERRLLSHGIRTKDPFDTGTEK
jgi:hypothetical protein